MSYDESHRWLAEAGKGNLQAQTRAAPTSHPELRGRSGIVKFSGEQAGAPVRFTADAQDRRASVREGGGDDGQ
jgi:hypothetical protein